MAEKQGRLALITGATGGLGRSITRALAGRGIDLVLVGRNRDILDGLRTELLGTGVTVETIVADLTDRDERRNLPIRARSRAGEVDILVNNAGTSQTGAFVDIEPETVRRVIEVNLVAPMLLTRDLLPGMVERKKGHIVNVSSLAGRVGLPWASVYAATKAALSEWTLALNTELRGTGVAASAVAPGLIRNAGMFADLDIEAPAILGTSEPQDVARAVLKALESDGGEILVSSRPARGLMALRALLPGTVDDAARRLGLHDYLEKAIGAPRKNTD
jgi:short-subunit dehydrogenase